MSNEFPLRTLPQYHSAVLLHLKCSFQCDCYHQIHAWVSQRSDLDLFTSTVLLLLELRQCLNRIRSELHSLNYYGSVITIITAIAILTKTRLKCNKWTLCNVLNIFIRFHPEIYHIFCFKYA